jgi:hypothetical protein
VKVQLVEAHVINDRVCEKGEILDLPSDFRVTPLMNPLDDEARQAVKAERLRVWGRYENTPHGWPPQGPLIDDPPIPRPLTENQPVYHYTGHSDYWRDPSPETPGLKK